MKSIKVLVYDLMLKEKYAVENALLITSMASSGCFKAILVLSAQISSLTCE